MDSPIFKAALQAGTLSAISNILGQLITCYQANEPFAINATELAHFVIFALFSTPPNFLWQSWLEAQFPAYTKQLSHSAKEKVIDDAMTSSRDASDSAKKRAVNSEKDSGTMNKESLATMPEEAKAKLNIKNTAAKFALDQTFGAAVNTVLFLAGIALLRGRSWEVIEAEVREKFWPMIFAGQKLWPMVSVLSYTVVPFEYRLLFGSTVGLFWGIYLSLMSGGRK